MISAHVVQSKFGRLLIAICDEERRVRFLGYDVTAFKLFVFVLSAMMAGLFSVNALKIWLTSFAPDLCLRGVDLVAEPGRITCVLGRNGVGESSLMRAIMGLEGVSAGSITWEGRDITRLPPAERVRASIGYAPQGREIFPFLTVRENLEIALAAAPRGSGVPNDVSTRACAQRRLCAG